MPLTPIDIVGHWWDIEVKFQLFFICQKCKKLYGTSLTFEDRSINETHITFFRIWGGEWLQVADEVADERFWVTS